MKFKIWRIRFWKVFYYYKISDWTSGFPELTEASSAHWDEINYSAQDLNESTDHVVGFVLRGV